MSKRKDLPRSRASFSLEDEYIDLLQKIAAKTRRSMTDEVRLMIDLRAAQVGLTPIGKLDVHAFDAPLSIRKRDLLEEMAL